MQVKLLALDLDGTIVSDLKNISERAEKAIEAAMDQGVSVTLATGRAHKMAARFARRLNIDAPLISYQGGLVKDYQSGETLLARTIPSHTSRQVIKFARANKLPMALFTPQSIFIELPSSEIFRIFTQAGAEVMLVNNLLCAVDEEQLPLKFMFAQLQKDTGRIHRLLKKEFGQKLAVTRSLATLVEATMPDVSKGAALQHLAQHLEIPLSQTMAIGDEDNDVTLLQNAGLGVAMGNASAAAKEAANVIAPPLSADGAAWAIEKYILGTSDAPNP